MRITVPIIVLLQFLIAFEGFSQIRTIGTPTISNFSRNDYHAGTQNWMVLQNENGIIYFANNKGLLEFDGTNWQIYSLPNGTIVRSIAIDESGKLYVGGQDEFGYMEFDEFGKNNYRSLTHLIPENLTSFNDIWKIFIKKDEVYFCSEKMIFRLFDNKINVIQPPNERFENFFKIGDKIWIQDLQKGIFELRNNQLILIPNSNIFPNERIVAILPYSNDQQLIFSYQNGLFLKSNDGISPWQTKVNNFIKQHQAYAAIRLKNGNYAVGTAQNGFIIFNKNGDIEIHLNQSLGLQNNTVLSLTQDIQQNLWLGLDNGIDYAEINSPFSQIQAQEGITGTGYNSIIHKGKLYLGTNRGLYFTDWNGQNSSSESPKFQPVKNTLGQVWSLNKLKDNLIIGQHKGASYLNDGTANLFSNIQGAWKFMQLEKEPNLAIEGTYSGLYLYKDQNFGSNNTSSPNWVLIGKIDGFDESARIFEEDEDGNIWVSHAYKGLYKLSPTSDYSKIETSKRYASSNGLPGELFINVSKIRNELVFTSPQGVFKYNASKDQFVPHQDFIEIFGENRNYHRLLEDNLGDIWFSIGNEFGVLKVEEQGVYNKTKVLYFNQIQEDLVDGFEHIYAHDRNNVFIGTEKGFIHYSPLIEKNTGFPFNLIIRKVTSITDKDSVVFWGNATNQITQKSSFHYEMNDFRFSFSAPYYEKIGYLTYRFKLDGFEDTWTEWAPKTEKEYTNLPSGNYAFKVQAKNAYGQLSNEEVYKFSISPPWYWAWYAKLAYFILGVLGLFSLTKYISKRERRKTAAFKLEQTKKLEQKEAEFKKEVEKSESQIIKLRNEKLNENIQHKNSQLASATMHLVQKSEILMKIKSDLKSMESDAPSGIKKKIQQISRAIESNIQYDENWEQFENYFDQVHENFFKRLRMKFPELTPKDQKLCAYLRMNLSTKEIAPLLNISVRGVEISRYRLRKKLGLNSEVNLVAFIMEV